jgi:hypothetical protein
VRTLTTHAREERSIETVPSELDQRIGVASLPWSVVVASRTTRERIDGRAERCATHGVKEPFDEDGTSLAGSDFKGAVFDVLQLLRLERLSIVCVARMCAVGPEAGEAMTQCLVEEWLLLEGRGRRGRLKRPRGPGEQRQVREAQSSVLDRRNALGKGVRLRTNRDRVRCRGGGHAALQPHPLERTQTSLPFLLRGVGECCRHSRELQLDPIDDPAETGQLAA